MHSGTPIVPPGMRRIHEELGYTPGLRVGGLIFVAGQVGRDGALQVIADPEAQFRACWANLGMVLAEAGCDFSDVVDLTTYHVDMHAHYDLFRQVKNEVFPRGTCPWTAIGVSSLSRAGLLLEIKAVAQARG
jgi:enamine deaminase RidA (YjgF/YER057c/UK114 family)